MKKGCCWEATSQEYDNTFWSCLMESLEVLKVSFVVVVDSRYLEVGEDQR